MDVFCPQCGHQYRLAEEKIDAKIECSQCHRVFFAKTTIGKRPRPKDNSKTYIGFGVLAIFVVVSFVVLKGGPAETVAAPKPAPKMVDTGSQNPRVVAVRKWSDAIAAQDRYNIANASDMGAVQQLFGITGTREYANTTGSEREATDQAILEAFASHPTARYLREMECTHGQLLGDPENAEASTGSVRLYLSPRPDFKNYIQNSHCEMKVDFRMDGPFVRVTNWTVEFQPREKAANTGFIPHDKIERPKTRDVEIGGKTYSITESEPVALDHLAETPEEMRKEIDSAIADLLASADPLAPGHLFNRSVNRLTKGDQIRQACVPRLLNALFDLHRDVVGNNLKLNAVVRALRQCTGAAYAYPVAEMDDAAQAKALRQSAIKQWFAFWSTFHKSAKWDALIDKEENLDGPTPDKGKTDNPDKNKK